MKRYLALIFVLTLAACSKPTDTIVPTSIDTIDSIKPLIAKLAENEKELFINYILRHRREGAIPKGTTIGMAIAEQRKFDELQAATLKKLRAVREEWSFESEKDKFTDEVKAFATISEEKDDGQGFIHVACFPSGLELKVGTGKYIGDKEMYVPNVKYRVDSEAFVTMKMKPTSKSYVYENDMDSKFLKALMSGRKILVELTSYDYETSLSSFSLNGAAPAINKVLELCKEKKK